MANVKNNIKELFNVVVKESNQIIKIPKYTHFNYNKIEKNIVFTENKSKELFDLFINLFEIYIENDFDNLDDYGGEEKTTNLNTFTLSTIEIYKRYKLIVDMVVNNTINVNLLEPLNQIINIIKTEHDLQFKDIEFIKSNKNITYSKLRTILLRNKLLSIKTGHGMYTAGYLEDIEEVNDTFFGKYLSITYTTFEVDGKDYAKKEIYDLQPAFSGEMCLSDIKFLPITHEEMVSLNLRGKNHKKYVKSKTPPHLEYSGNIIIQHDIYQMEYPAKGKIIIDTGMHKQLFPNEYSNNVYANNYNTLCGLDQKGTNINSFFDYCMLPPTIVAFSFVTKNWGKINIEKVAEIQWDDDSYSKLVMEPSKKEILRTLIMNSKFGFTDIVKGKSGGCIFLLHGTPGVGKTLTAETISETLHKPLYSITSGELGTDVISMENKMTKILDMIQRWDAIILIDEADIFLEKRDSQNLERNAIVCLFLRLLEKYHGIMFLTTNRRTELDQAFQSRISLILEYNDLNYDNRLKVWKNLLSSAKINLNDEYVNECAKYVMNGRNIKNIIRLAHTLAIGQNSEPQEEHFDKIIELYMNEYKLVKQVD